LKTRYATEKVPSMVVDAKSPIVTPSSSPPGFARSLVLVATTHGSKEAADVDVEPFKPTFGQPTTIAVVHVVNKMTCRWDSDAGG
jgi:hypothetical protein